MRNPLVLFIQSSPLYQSAYDILTSPFIISVSLRDVTLTISRIVLSGRIALISSIGKDFSFLQITVIRRDFLGKYIGTLGLKLKSREYTFTLHGWMFKCRTP